MVAVPDTLVVQGCYKEIPPLKIGQHSLAVTFTCELVAQRLEQYVRVASKDDQTGQPTLARLCAIYLPPPLNDGGESGRDGTWSRVEALYE